MLPADHQAAVRRVLEAGRRGDPEAAVTALTPLALKARQPRRSNTPSAL